VTLPRDCLVTITDDGFAAGTELLVFSFLRYNPWFRGDVIVLVGGALGAHRRERLQALAPVHFAEPGADLVARVDTLAQTFPELRKAGPRFASLEAFGLAGYDRVVYIDSDAFVTGDVSALFRHDAPLVVCGDGSRYDAALGDAAGARAANRARYGVALDDTFNTGMVSIGRPFLDRAVRDELVAMIDPVTWAQVEMLGWTDQLILNRRYAGCTTFVDGRYNYMPILEAKIRRVDDLAFCDARIVHMAGRDKPWHPAPPGRPPSLAKFHELWQQLAELLPDTDNDDTAARLAAESHAMRDVMRPRTDLEASP
jgi:hypothetical protein